MALARMDRYWLMTTTITLFVCGAGGAKLAPCCWRVIHEPAHFVRGVLLTFLGCRCGGSIGQDGANKLVLGFSGRFEA